MILWRLVPARWIDEALSGTGAARYGGRWNSPGRRAVYLSCDASTTALEMLTTFQSDNAPAIDYRLVKVEYEGSLTEQTADMLLPGWDRPEDASVARTIGDAFLSAARVGGLQVPSVVMPQACNVILNPAHVDIRGARVLATYPYRFDLRLT